MSQVWHHYLVQRYVSHGAVVLILHGRTNAVGKNAKVVETVRGSISVVSFAVSILLHGGESASGKNVKVVKSVRVFVVLELSHKNVR